MPLIKVNCEIGTRARTTLRIAVVDTGLAIYRMAPMDEWPRASPARERASSYRFGVSVGDVRAGSGFAVGQICPERYRRRLETGLKIKRTPYREAETTYISGALYCPKAG